MSNTQRSFFRQYFLYRLKGLIPFAVINLALSTVCGPLQICALRTFVKASVGASDFDGYGPLFFTALSVYVLALSLPGLIIIGMIIPPVTRKYHNDRAHADTLGALPITYRQRFWGDFLSELAAYVPPVIPACVFTYLTARSTDDIAARYNAGLGFGNISGFAASCILTLLLCCVSGLAASGFMTQCCGKSSSAAMYSVIAAVLLPTLVITYINTAAASAVGVDNSTFAFVAGGAVPPFGTLLQVLANAFVSFRVTDDETGILGMHFTVNEPLLLCAALAITALLIVGAYFIGKKRPAELIGQDFIFENAFRAISITAALTILGVYAGQYMSVKTPDKLIAAFVATLVILTTFELLHRKKKLRPLTLLIKYAAVCAAGFAFVGISTATRCFGAEDRLPDAGAVSRISVSGTVVDNMNNNNLQFDDEAAISVIIDEHRKLLSDKQALSTGEDLEICYRMKNGSEITRAYAADKDQYFSVLIKKLIALPQSGNNAISVLKDENRRLTVRGWLRVNGETRSFRIAPERVSDFRKALIEDKIECAGKDYSDATVVGRVDLYDADKASYLSVSELFIYTDHRRTIEFILDPDNLREEANYDTTAFAVDFSTNGTTIYVTLPTNTDDSRLHELYSLFVTESMDNMSGEYSPCFTIYPRDGSYRRYVIRKEDEKRAAELFLSVVKDMDISDLNAHTNDSY